MKYLKLLENRNSYTRVVPRDFFNESKLLKCMGFLALRILNSELPEGITIEIEESGDAFDIGMTQDGSLTVLNYPVTINGEDVTMKTTINAKDNFPFFCEIDYTEYLVFDDQGNFDKEFIERFKNSDSIEE